mmetsp:Transcript_2358/g.5631  ORF Transcript_2358/g.5631 Transcript_2358/m.5631 type:complete len:220 (+) Transcript_2358:775-1434(+)
MARMRSMMYTVKAAFSKSVRFSSMGLNSTRQLMLSWLVGGGLKRTVFQLVDWMFSKWSLSLASSCSSFPSNTTSGSRMKRCATCVASRSSMPASHRRLKASSLMGRGTSLNSSRMRSLCEMKQSIEEYLLLWIRCSPGRSSSSPRSERGLSSTAPEITSQRTSVSARSPFQTGDAAERARNRGARMASWSYRNLASSTSFAWNVICRHPAPIPKAMQSR